MPFEPTHYIYTKVSHILLSLFVIVCFGLIDLCSTVSEISLIDDWAKLPVETEVMEAKVILSFAK